MMITYLNMSFCSHQKLEFSWWKNMKFTLSINLYMDWILPLVSMYFELFGIVQGLRLCFFLIWLWQTETYKSNSVWWGIWNSEMWTLYKLQSVFIDTMMRAIYSSICKHRNIFLGKKSLIVPTVMLFSYFFFQCFGVFLMPICFAL